MPAAGFTKHLSHNRVRGPDVPSDPNVIMFSAEAILTSADASASGLCGGMIYNGEQWEESADVEDSTHTIQEKTVGMSCLSVISRWCGLCLTHYMAVHKSRNLKRLTMSTRFLYMWAIGENKGRCQALSCSVHNGWAIGPWINSWVSDSCVEREHCLQFNHPWRAARQGLINWTQCSRVIANPAVDWPFAFCDYQSLDLFLKKTRSQ